MKPLTGLKVLDFTHALAGPFCTYHLALLGAEVIKVERPGVGDDMRHYTEHAGAATLSAPFVAANAGKRSLTLDLKSPAAKDIVRQLVANADVMVENYRPGVPAKLGLDWDSVQRINPRLVYCSVTGFGQTGDLRDWPAYDHIIQAISGIMMVNGEPDQGPLKVGIPLSDTFAGFLAAYAVQAALLQRARTGVGQFIDVSMLDATLLLMAQIVSGVALTGKPPRRTGNRGFRLVATSDTYQTADGYLSIGANHQPQFESLCRVLGEERLLDDPRFATHQARMANNDQLRLVLEKVFATRSAAELELKLAEAKVPAGKVRGVMDVLDHPHVVDRGILIDATVPGLDHPMKVVGAGFRFEHDGPATSGAVPAIGEHSDAILSELGYSQEYIAELRRTGVL